MIDLIARRDMIRDRLVDYVETDLGSEARVIAPAVWVSTTDPSRLFGYRNPYMDGDRHVVEFCPDVLAAYTGALSDESIDIYLDIVEYMIARHIVHFETIPDPVQRAIKVDDELFEMKPEAMQFLTTVQMNALDMLAEDDD